MNRNRQGGQDGAQGRGKRTGGHGGHRPKFKGLDDRPPPVNPYEWSEETRRAFKVHMENWAQEEDPRIRDREMESEPSDWSQVTEDEYPDEAVRKIGVPTNNNVHVKIKSLHQSFDTFFCIMIMKYFYCTMVPILEFGISRRIIPNKHIPYFLI